MASVPPSSTTSSPSSPHRLLPRLHTSPQLISQDLVNTKPLSPPSLSPLHISSAIPRLISPPSSSASSSSSAPSSPPPASSQKSPRWRWDKDDDLRLVSAVLAEEPWAVTHGQVQKAWIATAERFARSVDTRDKVPDDRACKDRYMTLYRARKALDANPPGRSGSSEEYGELEVALTRCVDATESHKKRTEEGKQKELDKKRETDTTQKRLRQHTIERFSQRRHSSASPASSSPTSVSDEKSEGDALTPETGHSKRLKPTLKLQQDMLETQKEASSRLGEQFEKLVKSADVLSEQSVRSNDLLERFLNR